MSRQYASAMEPIFREAPPRPKKSLGQHFLINPSICSRIAGLLNAEAGDQILEIGPGPGALTSQLVLLPYRRLLLIEKDRHYANQHENTQQAEVLCQDALTFDWTSLPGAWKLAGNLPYNIASPLIWNIVSQKFSWTTAVFMVQKEVAERICAKPDSRKYGALSVWIQCHAKVKLQFGVGPGNFRPPPSVDSAVVSFWPLAEKPLFPSALDKVLKICFQKRRKQLGHIFSQCQALAEALDRLNIDPKSRPENLTCAQYISLAKALATKTEL